MIINTLHRPLFDARRPSGNGIQLGEVEVKEHDVITIDGSTGEVYLGTVDRRSATEDEDFQAVLKWADDLRQLKVCVWGGGCVVVVAVSWFVRVRNFCQSFLVHVHQEESGKVVDFVLSESCVSFRPFTKRVNLRMVGRDETTRTPCGRSLCPLTTDPPSSSSSSAAAKLLLSVSGPLRAKTAPHRSSSDVLYATSWRGVA